MFILESPYRDCDLELLRELLLRRLLLRERLRLQDLRERVWERSTGHQLRGTQSDLSAIIK